jgi:hypothetical protein
MFFYYVLALVLLVTVRQAVPISISIIGLTVLLGKVLGVHNPAWVIISSPILLELILRAITALAFARFGQRKGLGIVMLTVGIVASLYICVYQSRAGRLAWIWCSHPLAP